MQEGAEGSRSASVPSTKKYVSYAIIREGKPVGLEAPHIVLSTPAGQLTHDPLSSWTSEEFDDVVRGDGAAMLCKVGGGSGERLRNGRGAGCGREDDRRLSELVEGLVKKRRWSVLDGGQEA